MAEKFPSLPNVKQRVFSIDLARFPGALEERAVAVTAERGRITLFWSRVDGSWGSIVRAHDNLSQRPRRPESPADFGWTPRTGIGAAGQQVVLVYKRCFAQSSPRDLWIDLFDFNESADEFSGAEPLRFPRDGLGLDRFGWGIWADAVDGQLQVVAQVFRTDAPDTPRLMLLQHEFPVSDPATFEDPTSWAQVDLDDGGWDFAARRDENRLAVLHRRTAAAYATDLFLPVDPGFGGQRFGVLDVPLSDNPADVSRTLTEMTVSNLVLVDVDLASNTVTAIDETLPFGENPQIHSVNPFIASVDRLAAGRVVIRRRGVLLRQFRSHGHLLMRTSQSWRTRRLFDQKMRWPRYQEGFARMHQGVALELARAGGPALRLSWASLWSLRPIVLFKREEGDKGTLLTFGHQDSDLGALRATTFVVFEDDGGNTLKANPEAFALLDIGHRHIFEPSDGPAEYAQLNPFSIRSRGDHSDGLVLTRVEQSANTMCGALVAATERPTSFYAYTEMGDGGARVIFESGLELPPPTATADEKSFRIDWVAEPTKLGRAWVRLETPIIDTFPGPAVQPVPTDLPGYYFDPISRNPGSLVFQQQPSLDALAFVADRLRGEPRPVLFSNSVAFDFATDGVIHYPTEPGERAPQDIEFIGISRAAADSIQNFILEPDLPVPLPPAVRSGTDQPFAIEIQPLQNAPFANETLAFAGVVVDDTSPAGFQFDWTFSDGTTDTGQQIEHTFTRTQPDFSRPTPGPVRGDIRVELTVTVPDGRVSTVAITFELPDSFWATLWTAYGAFRRAPDNILDDDGNWQITDDEWEAFLLPGMFIQDVSLRFYRYRMRFLTDAEGRGTRVELSIRTVHDGQFRFRGNDAGQGDILYEVPLTADLDDVRLTGDFGGGLGSVVQIDNVNVGFQFKQRFSPGVQTSEQRGSRADTETLVDRRGGIFTPSTEEMIPSGLCCLPVGELEPDLDSITVRSSLTLAGWSLAILLPAVIAAVGLGALMLLLVVIAPALIPMLLAGSASLVAAALMGAGLGLIVAIIINFFVLNGWIQDIIRERLEKPETVTSFREAGLFTHAGEGLMEAITRHLIRQAQLDRHAVADPGPAGRDRFRSPFFETIVVSENECKVELRV